MPDLDAVGRLGERKHLTAHGDQYRPRPRTGDADRAQPPCRIGLSVSRERATPSAAVPPTESEFTQAVARHRSELHRHCARLLGSQDAEDALQETLLRAWRARRTCTAASPRGWLYAIATNACYDLIARRSPTSLPFEEDHAPEAPPEQQPDATAVDRETVELAVLTAIQHLPPLQQASFVMRDVLSWSAQDTASALETSLPATNSALQRARRGLRTRLAPGRLHWSCAEPCDADRRTLHRYLSAVDAPSNDAATHLLGSGLAY
jgi:RNA polymerase sigma-70 factor (ECF subfamily)